MQPIDRTKVIHFDDKAHQGLALGVETMRKAVGSTYGPGGRNVLIKKKYVAPILTRDGVTVARDIAGHGNRLPDDDANMAAQLAYQASEKTNKTAGDGTTLTVVLLAATYAAGRRLIAAGEDPMQVKRQLDKARQAIVDFVQSKSITCDDKMLRQVAEISSGDPELGAMIADLMADVGANGAVTINYHNAPYVEVEKVTGYLFDNGFRFMDGETLLEQPVVVVSQKRIASTDDIVPILEFMAQHKKQFVIVGDVAGVAQETLLGALSNPKLGIVGVAVPPPAYGQDGHEYFKDIAAYTGARLFLESDSFKDITLQDLGHVKSARLSKDRSVLFGDNTTGDAIAERLATINKQQESTDVTPSLAEQLEQRHAKLAGKVSIIKVGAATEMGREELFFRVEDAVEACKSALSSGVVAGGATTLLHASNLKDLPVFIGEALQVPFRLLTSNAGLDAGLYLQRVLEAQYGYGYNLREMTSDPRDLLKNGIVDPTKVITQAVTNAFENASNLLTVGTTITEVVEDDKNTPE
jgi:chaperonin GroEL